MRVLKFDSGERFDDPNSYWGDPSYVLEPGDPGYQEPAAATLPPPSQPKPKNKMPKSDYLKSRDTDFATQLSTFKLNLGSYAALLGISAAQTAALAADTDYFAYTLASHDIVLNQSKQWTAWKDLTRIGGTPPASGSPAASQLPEPVPAVAPGVELRFRALVKQIKAHPAYNEAIGSALGIEGPASAAPDLTTLKPKISLELTGGQVLVRWGWQGQSAFLDMVEICVDRADGRGFTPLAFDTTPDYLDTSPLPPTLAKWTYKVIYRVGDQRVGQWSDEVTLTVGS